MRGLVGRITASIVLVSVCSAPLVMSTSADAKGLKAITAKVPAGYRLVAMSRTGVLTAGTVKGSTTTIVPTASVSTLHLVSSTGSYAGPVVVGTRKVGRTVRAILGVKPGASLGRISYKSAGYGKASVKSSSVSSSTYANASKSGVPYGAGTLGFVSGASKASVMAASVRAAADETEVGGDPDKDGIPNAIDVDDNGDGSLDVVDEKTQSAGAGKTGPRPYIFSDFFVDLVDIIRVNDAASAEATKAIVKKKLKFVFGSSTENGAVQNVRIDCAAIAWCATATVFAAPGAATVAWSTVDKDGDGRFFDLDSRMVGSNMNFDSSINPNVFPAEVQPGQMFNFELRYRTGKTIVIPSALTSFFVTAPAPSLIGGTAITYPVAANTGTFNNPIPTANGTTLRIETARPMRPLMPKESATGGMKEMGQLKYWITLSRAGDGKPPSTCNSDAYSSPTSNLTPIVNGPQPMLKDGSPDSSPGQPVTVGFNVDLSRCNIAGVTTGDRFMIDLNVGDAANNHSVANFHVVVG